MSFLPAKHNFKIWKGATFRKRMTLLQGDVNSNPRDFTGYSAVCRIRNPNTNGTLLVLSTGNSGIVLGGVAGYLELVISATNTNALTWTDGVYDLIVTSPAAEADPLLFGAFKVLGV